MKTLSRWLQVMLMTMAASLVALPIVVVCAAALNGGRSMLFPPQDPTFARFGEFFLTETVWTNALLHSILIAFSSAALAVVIAWPVAYWLWRHNSRWSKVMATITSMPFALPPIVFGVGLGFMWAFVDLLGTVFAGVVSHAVLLVALPLATVSVGLQSIDKSHIDAASTMGATEAMTLRTVIFPLTLPYTVSGFFFTLILSFNEFIVMFFVSASAYSTVTLQIFNSLRNGFTPTMAVGAITFIVASVLVFGLIARFGDLPRLMGADQSRNHGA
jgi:putative spermidine/putrescine transport system permease protein